MAKPANIDPRSVHEIPGAVGPLEVLFDSPSGNPKAVVVFAHPLPTHGGTMHTKMVFQGAEQKRNRHRLLVLIDEFPSLNRMEIFADALSYMAGYGLKAYLITQDIRQIVDAYGHNESIVSNCHVRIAFAPNQVETAELLSKMTGTQTVQKASYNFSGSRFSPVMGHMNASVDHIERPEAN